MLMNWVDIFLIAVIIISVLAGWRRGFIMGSLDLLSWIGSVVIGYIFYPYMANGLEKMLNLNVWLLPVSFILTTLIARLLIGYITGLILRAIPQHINNTRFNKFLG